MGSFIAVPILSSQSSAKSSPPTIKRSFLSKHGWTAVDSPPRTPSFTDDGHTEDLRKTSWTQNAFYGTTLPSAVEEVSPLEDVNPLKHIWATRVTPSDHNTKLAWTGGESGEAIVTIDGTTEAAFQRYVTEEILGAGMEYRGEYHRKGAKQGSLWGLSNVPWIGSLLSQGASLEWDMQSSITTGTGDTAHISQYFYSIPVTSFSSDAEENIDNEVSLDYRGLYIDWFTADNEFYAAGGVYPQDEQHLNARLSQAFDEGLGDWDGWGSDPDFTLGTDGNYEQEMVELLANIS